MPYREGTAALLDRIDELERASLPARARLRRLAYARRERLRATLRMSIGVAGLFLVPMLTVVAVMALLVQMATRDTHLALRHASLNSAKALRSAAELWTVEKHECPTVQTLIDGDYVDATAKFTDGWDGVFVISCNLDGVSVRSPGKDAILGTADDISTE